MTFLTANGSFDSHKNKPGVPYETIGWEGIDRLMDSPAAVEKALAPIVILSDYNANDGRVFAVQREHGSYGGLAVDIDRGSPTLDQLLAAVQAVVGNVRLRIYSSATATAEMRKWRVLIPLASPLPGCDYTETQHALFSLLGSRGLLCDGALARTGQLIYLPNVPPGKRGADGKPLFYVSRQVEGPLLELGPDCAVVRVVQETRARQAAAAAEAKNRSSFAGNGGLPGPIAQFNAKHSVANLLGEYGFEKDEGYANAGDDSKPIAKYRHPDKGTSGSPSMGDYGDHWVCLSDWARAEGLGRPAESGYHWGDAFDLYKFFRHGNDEKAAVRAISEIAGVSVDFTGSAPILTDAELESLEVPEFLAWPSPPVIALKHGLLGKFIRLAAPQTEADPVALAGQFVTFFGCLVGRGPHGLVSSSRHGLNLNCAVVGATADGRKGAGLDVCRYLFSACERSFFKTTKAERLAGKEPHTLGSLTSGEGLIHQIHDDVIASRINKESGEPEWYLVKPAVEDKRLLVTATEFGGVLRAAKIQTSTLTATLRDCWDGNDLGNHSKMNGVKATAPHVAIICHITPGELHALATDDLSSGGFWNRFLWLLSRRSRLLPEGGDMSVVDPLVSELRRCIERARQVKEMKRTPEAAARWREWYTAEMSAAAGTSLLNEVRNRGPAQVLRLSMIFALLANRNDVDLASLEAALDFWAYCRASANHIFSKGQVAAVVDGLAGRIMKALSDAGAGGLTRSELVEKLRIRRENRSDFVSVLGRLKADGKVTVRTEATAGRPRETWNAVVSADPFPHSEKAFPDGFSGSPVSSVSHGKNTTFDPFSEFSEGVPTPVSFSTPSGNEEPTQTTPPATNGKAKRKTVKAGAGVTVTRITIPLPSSNGKGRRLGKRKPK